jgi:hypothetical protein
MSHYTTVYLGNSKFLLGYVARDINHLHAITQGLGYRFEYISGADKQHL